MAKSIAQEMWEETQKNAQAWHTQGADQNALHDRNVELYSDIDRQTGLTSTYDPTSGRWTSVDRNGNAVDLAGKFAASGAPSSGAGVYTGGGAVRDDAPKVNDYSDYLQDLYDARTEANLSALKSAYEQNVNTLNAAAEKIPGQYQAARNQVASANEVERRNMNQYAAASGLNSGTAGQVQLAQNTAYQGNLAKVDTAEADALADLELQRTQLATQYENAIVQAKADGNYQLASALYQEKVRVDEALQAQAQYLSSLELQKQQAAFQRQQYADSLGQYQAQTEQGRADTEYERGLALAQYLYNATGDASGFAAYGYTPQQIAAMQAQWQAANTVDTSAVRRTGSGGSGGGGSAGADYDGLFAAASASGYPRSFIANNYKKYGFSSGTGLYDEYASWADEVQGGTASIVAGNTSGSAYDSLLNELRDYMKDVAQGSMTLADVVSEIEAARRKGLITAAEAERLAAALGV